MAVAHFPDISVCQRALIKLGLLSILQNYVVCYLCFPPLTTPSSNIYSLISCLCYLSAFSTTLRETLAFCDLKKSLGAVHSQVSNTAPEKRRASSITTSFIPLHTNHGSLQLHHHPIRLERWSSPLPSLQTANLSSPPPIQQRMAPPQRSTEQWRIAPASRSSGSNRRNGLAVLSFTGQHVYPYAAGDRDGGFA